MPIKTMLVMDFLSGKRFLDRQNLVENFGGRQISLPSHFPVKQNRHPIAQPTWVERQRVKRDFSGIRTLSIRFPSSS